ncbi:hypothetical protein BOS5A_210189 [Bosea sp. EC-HK365B]|nr:hypothetical protein BOSE21B_30863 [Bosea sp. 21B]VVT59398.1 hypothetical protein BOS5A_210189 [Bosea sp. EC-HK365B]VXB89653.1 hypothetical protein BOSE127_160083 [Bosea sp. 127]
MAKFGVLIDVRAAASSCIRAWRMRANRFDKHRGRRHFRRCQAIGDGLLRRLPRQAIEPALPENFARMRGGFRLP